MSLTNKRSMWRREIPYPVLEAAINKREKILVSEVLFFLALTCRTASCLCVHTCWLHLLHTQDAAMEILLLVVLDSSDSRNYVWNVEC